MKQVSALRSFRMRTLLAAAVVLLGGQALATSYYWDCTSPIETSGFGTAGGTWGTDLRWSTSSAGTVTPGIQSPTTSDDLNFGYTTTGLATGTVTVTGIQNAKSLTFASGSGAITLSGGTNTLPATSTITVNNAADTISSVIAGAGTSLTKAGTGTLTLTSRNTYSGTTTVSGGMLALAELTTSSSTIKGPVVVLTNGVLRWNLNNQILDSVLITNHAGTMDIQGNFDYFGGLTLSSNALFTGSANGWFILNGTSPGAVTTAGSGSAGTIAAKMAIASQYGGNTGNRTQTFNVVDGTSLTVSGSIVNYNQGTAYVGSILKTGAGTLTLSGTNAYTGPTTISAGTLTIGGAGQLGSGTYAANITNNAAFNYASSAAQTLNGIISGTGSLTNLGTGALTLTGTNTYTGATTVDGGSFLVNGSIASATTMTGGTLGGSGTISNSVTVSGGTLSPGASAASAGTLTIQGNLSLASGGTATFDLAGSATVGGGVNDLIQLSGTARDLTLNSNPVTINPLAPLAVGTPYTLITFTGTRSGSLGTVSGIGRQPATVSYDDTPGAGKVMVTFGVASPAGLIWNSASSSVWDVSTTPNWSNTVTSLSDKFYQSDNVTFDDTPGVQKAITLNTTVTPSTVTVNSSVNAFNFSGTGKISGSASLTKSGTSTLIVSNANDYVGATTINGGTLELAGSSSIADASAIALNGGSVRFSGGGTRSGPISGAGNLVKAGTNTLTLSGANSYTGVTTLAAGTLSLATLANGGVNSPIGAASSTAANLVFNGGALSYTGPNASSDRGFTLAYGTNIITVTTAAAALKLTGGCPTNTVFLKKLGAGTLVLDPGAGSVYSLGSLSADDGTLVLKSGTVTTTRANPDVPAYATGAGARNNGKLVVDGATLNMGSGTLKPGAASNGNLDILSGTVNAANIVLGHNGTVFATQSGGNVTATNIYHQDAGTATYTMTGGTLTVQSIFNNSVVVNTPFTFIMNGGTVRAAAGTTNLFANSGKAGPEVTVQLGSTGATIDTSLSSATIVRPLNDIPGQMGRLTKIGTNTLSLTATNTYSGATIVSNGVLRLTHTQVLAATNEVYIVHPGMINLDFQGTNIIRKLYINGEPMTVNVLYGQYNRSDYLSGTGYLLPTEGPPPKGTLVSFF